MSFSIYLFSILKDNFEFNERLPIIKIERDVELNKLYKISGIQSKRSVFNMYATFIFRVNLFPWKDRLLWPDKIGLEFHCLRSKNSCEIKVRFERQLEDSVYAL